MGERQPVVIITGAGQGIGRGMARYLLERGHCIAAFERDAQALHELTSGHGFGDRLVGYEVDVTDEQGVRKAVDAACIRFGALDGLINNAGISDPYNAPLEAMAVADFERILKNNLVGHFICAKQAASQLRRSKRGAIVNIASTRALQSEPHQEGYAAAKGGIVALTHALAMTLSPEVRVNAISPGYIDVSALKKSGTRTSAELRPIDHTQHPAGRVGRAEDVAALAEYLLAPASAFMTGQNIVLDGGMTLKMQYAE